MKYFSSLEIFLEETIEYLHLLRIFFLTKVSLQIFTRLSKGIFEKGRRARKRYRAEGKVEREVFIVRSGSATGNEHKTNWALQLFLGIGLGKRTERHLRTKGIRYLCYSLVYN